MSEDIQQKYLQTQVELQHQSALNVELQRQLKQALDGQEELRALLKDLQAKLDVLIAQSKKRNKKEYGTKTERHNPRPATTTAKNQTTDSSSKAADKSDKATGIKHILDNATGLEREPVPHTVKPEDAICPTCSVETERVGHLLTHQLEMVSASLKVIDHMQETRSCPKCKQYIVTAEKPCPPIPGSYAGPRLLAEIIVGKLDDGLPNNRQQKIFGRQNVTIPRSTQSDWMQYTANTLSLLYAMLKDELLKSSIIKTDDSSIKIQDRSHKKNMRKGKITTYIGDNQHKVTLFDYSPNLSFGKNLEFLKDFCGIVQADAAGGFDALFTDGQRTEAGCSAHSRRRYFEAGLTENTIAPAVLDIYRELYQIERQIKDKPAAFRLAMRRRKSKHLIKLLRKIIVQAKGRLHPTHDLMRAIEYTLKHWRALTRFLKNPDIAIGRVNDWRGGFRTWGVSVVRLLSRFLGVSIQSITPFPAAAHQTGHAHFAHPAFTCMNSSRLRSQQVGA